MKSLILGSILLSALGGSLVYFLAGDSLQNSFRYLTNESQVKNPNSIQPRSMDKSRTETIRNTYIGNGNMPASTLKITADKKTDTRTKEADSNGRKAPPPSSTASKQAVSRQNEETYPKSLNYRCMKCGKITALAYDSHVEICKYCKSTDLIELPTNTGNTPQQIIRNAINTAEGKTPGSEQGSVIRQAIEAAGIYSSSIMEKE